MVVKQELMDLRKDLYDLIEKLGETEAEVTSKALFDLVRRKRKYTGLTMTKVGNNLRVLKLHGYIDHRSGEWYVSGGVAPEVNPPQDVLLPLPHRLHEVVVGIAQEKGISKVAVILASIEKGILSA